MEKQIKELIEKYELKRKTILELIQNSETTEKCFKELAVERFLKQFLFDLRALEKLSNVPSNWNKPQVSKRESLVCKGSDCELDRCHNICAIRILGTCRGCLHFLKQTDC